jgi:2-polyprenyl-6-methoxyphenol hydroxylase-like FAD-dependent oxidoreductase
LGLEAEVFAGREFFAAYEFETEGEVEGEIRVVLDDASTNVLWPLAGNKCRWTFQLSHPRPPSEFPEKERRAVRLSQPAVDERIKEYVERVAQRRAPWFSSSVKEITWCTEVTFEHRLVKQFGKERCWLAGDAAHQTGPVGIQSMNVGFAEAANLVASLRKAFQERASVDLAAAYDRPWHYEWERLLGRTGGLRPQAGAGSWTKQRAGRMLSCLPGYGKELGQLANQLKLEFSG